MDIALIKSLLGVIATLGILALFAIYIKKINKTNTRNKHIKIKETLTLTAKIKLAIIEVGEENILFSISEKEIKLIKKMPSFEKVLKKSE